MAMICVICKLSGAVADAMLLPHTVVYRGYSLCEEHLHLWEGNRALAWTGVLDLARPKPKWIEQIEELPPLKAGEDIIVRGEEVTVVKVDLLDTDTVEEKQELLKEAVAKFDALPDFVGDEEAVTQHEKLKPKRKKKGKKKSKKKKGGKKK